MGITRHSLHKRRSTGGKKVALHKKRKYDMGRQAANTKLSNDQRTHMVRGRGGHIKFRALRMHTGNFSWPGEGACKPPPLPASLPLCPGVQLRRTERVPAHRRAEPGCARAALVVGGCSGCRLRQLPLPFAGCGLLGRQLGGRRAGLAGRSTRRPALSERGLLRAGC